jgi:hypothetical protein
MSSTGTIQTVASVGGLSIQSTIQRSAAGQMAPCNTSLAAAKVGALTTRTSDTAGELTMEAGHGITDGQVIDIYWIDVDGVSHCAYGATVGTVATNAVPFTGAAGDVLPADEYDVTACVQTEIDADFDGDKLEMIAAGSTLLSHVTFKESDGTVILATLLLANEGWSWVSDQGVANPLTGDPVGSIAISNGNSAAAATLQIGLVYNSDA